MSVYLDPEISCIPAGRYRWSKVTHLFADTIEELHAFAARLGLHREWFQVSRSGLEHYDLNSWRRKAAVTLGAIQCTREEAVAKWRSKRHHG